MNTNIFLLLLTAVVLMSSSCQRKREIGFCDLTESQMELVPYEKGQVITFINEKGNDVVLNVTDVNLEKKIQWKDCAFCNDYTTYMKKTFILKSEVDNLELELWLYNVDCVHYYTLHFSPSSYTALRVRLKTDVPIIWWLNMENRDGNLLVQKKRDITYHEKITIQGKEYLQVVEHSYESCARLGYPNKELVRLFYNKEYGIIQIKRGIESLLTLKN